MYERDEEEYERRYKNRHIRVDRCSWHTKSFYRVYDKKELNGRILNDLEELANEHGEDPMKMKAIRFAVMQMRFDPEGLPDHPSWDDEEFEKAALEALFAIIKKDGRITQRKATKIATSLRDKAAKANDIKKKEIYDRLIYELREAWPGDFSGLVDEVHGKKD